jgi:iron(III) transport system substrate-binding protein
VIEAANREGKLIVYSTTDSAAAGQLLRDFAELYPQLRVDYCELNSGELYSRFRAELAAGADTADLLWASSMDGQVNLAYSGLAAAYASPELPSLPTWAVWHNQAHLRLQQAAGAGRRCAAGPCRAAQVAQRQGRRL